MYKDEMGGIHSSIFEKTTSKEVRPTNFPNIDKYEKEKLRDELLVAVKALNKIMHKLN